MTFTIEHGGYFCFTSDAVYGNGNRQKENVYNIYGTLDFPNGVQKFNDSYSVWPVFNLCEGGVMISGNTFKKGSNWQHQANFMGGEFRATGNVSFQLKTNGGVFKAGYDTTLNVVNANNTLDLSNFIDMKKARLLSPAQVRAHCCSRTFRIRSIFRAERRRSRRIRVLPWARSRSRRASRLRCRTPT